MTTPDLVAEHAALTAEAAEIRRLVMEEFPIMSYQVARDRAYRLGQITERLMAIEKTKQWRGRDVR